MARLVPSYKTVALRFESIAFKRKQISIVSIACNELLISEVFIVKATIISLLIT